MLLTPLMLCPACGYCYATEAARVDAHYLVAPDRSVRVRYTLGWCLDCDSVRRIEDPDAALHVAEQRRLEAALSRRPGVFERFGTRWKRERVALAEDLEDIIRLRHLLANRTAPPGCLSCGSPRVHPWHDGHECPRPGCGGMLVAQPSLELCVTLHLPRRYYSPRDGREIGRPR